MVISMKSLTAMNTTEETHDLSFVVTGEFENNGHSDSDFFVSFWDIKENRTDTMLVGSTRFAGGFKGKCSPALPEVLTAIKAKDALVNACHKTHEINRPLTGFAGTVVRFPEAVVLHALVKDNHKVNAHSPRLGDKVNVVKGRKIKIGSTVTVAGEIRVDNWDNEVVPVRLENGSVVLTNIKNIALPKEVVESRMVNNVEAMLEDGWTLASIDTAFVNARNAVLKARGLI